MKLLLLKLLLHNVLLFSALLALSACATTAPSATGAKAPPDTAKTRPAQAPVEDLSRYRPTFTPPKEVGAPAPRPAVTPTNHVNAQIEQRLRDQAASNLNVKYAQGYRILAYVGLERDRAMSTRRAIISRYPEESDYLTFKQPLFRLYVGDYLTRLEAEQAMLRIKPLAPKATLEPAQIVLSKVAY